MSWHDFEIIATGNGEKLERWGNIYLLRPDPQAIWSAPFELAKYPKLHAHYHRSQKGGGEWQMLKHIPDEWNITYKDLKFIISPTNFKHTGLFPEQARNWDTARGLLKSGKSPKVLNLFGYTGGATVACAKGGATVTHVDSSKGMVTVCKRNADLNDIPTDRIRYIVDDCTKFVQKELRRGQTYDAIIMDPPSFGRGANGEVWKIERDLDELVNLCCKLLSDKPLFVLINSYTTGLQPTVMKNLLQTNLSVKSKIECYELTLPTTQGIDLPAGCSALATF